MMVAKLATKKAKPNGQLFVPKEKVDSVSMFEEFTVG